MNIAITGANGFIGKNLIKSLIKLPYQVNAIIRNSDCEKVISKNIKYTLLDYKKSNSQTFNLLGKPDVLVHLAWSNLDDYNSVNHLEVELENSYNFLEQMINSGVKNIIVAGTCFEYGLKEGILYETDKADPQNYYSEAKDILRTRLEKIKKLKNFKMTWMRIFYVYGAGQKKNTIYSQLNQAISNHNSEFNMSLGDQTRDFLHVDELSNKIKKLILTNNDNGIVNICSGIEKTIKLIVSEWIKNNNWNIKLNLGYYQYQKNEPMHFYGCNKKYKYLTKFIKN